MAADAAGDPYDAITDGERERIRRFLAAENRHPDQLLPDGISLAQTTESHDRPDVEARCRRARNLALAGITTRDIATDLDLAYSTVRKHLRGACACQHDQPPLVFDDAADAWHPLEGGDGDEPESE